MFKKALPLVLLGLTLSPPQANDDLLGGLLGDDFRVGYEAEINNNASVSTEGSESVNFQGSYISLNAEWKNKIRLVLTAKLEEIFKENKVSFNEDFDLGEFVEEAYIEIKEVGGSPIAVIVGKQPIPFSQKVQAMPLFNNNPIAHLQTIDEVFGVTVDLTEGLFGVFDQVELSAFETEAGDLEIGNVNGASVRLSKMLTDNILLTVGHAEIGASQTNMDHQRRTSVGLVAESTDGMLVGWVEGMYFSNDPTYPNSEFAITAGAMARVHRTTDVVVEFTYVENALNQYAIGTRTALTSRTTLGVEVRYNDYQDGRDDDVVFGVNISYALGSDGYRPNDEYLFDGDDDNF
ncbi:MAG: hypothetical protein VXV96_04145 [Bdellovibrionota bacterium]|jgi:hypothetical protein|nr:hypothetical protein [Bdellovibrionota bacterium]